jgi:parallel beta-helix repeat protein
VYAGDVDIDGDDRIMQNSVDIGADEVILHRAHNLNMDLWYSNIQDAINDAYNGDEIVVYPGIYYESVIFGDHKTFNLVSIDPNNWDIVANTIIDANGAFAGVVMGMEGTSALKGFAVTGATYGVVCDHTDATVSNCIIRDNTTYGIYSSFCSPVITNNKIYSNGVHNIYFNGDPGSTVQNNLIHDAEYGISLAYYWADANIINNTIVNHSVCGIKRTNCLSGSTPTITNCILWDNADDLYDCNATYSCIEDGDSCGQNSNICAAPCFVDAANDDYHLQPDSPCIDAGDQNGSYEGQTDIDGDIRVFGGNVDIGADETTYPDAHWWKLDETGGITAYDFISNNNGTFNGSNPQWVDGIIDGAVECNGVSDYFSVPGIGNSYTPYYNTFSVSGWFRTSQTTGIQTIVGSWNQYSFEPYPGVPHVQLYFGWQVLIENSKVTARFGAATQTFDITGQNNVCDGKWHHFVLIYPWQNINSVLYIDGQVEGTPQMVWGYSSNLEFRIGDGSKVSQGDPVLKGGPFNGGIDNIMLFDRVLSEDEVQQLYLEGN